MRHRLLFATHVYCFIASLFQKQLTVVSAASECVRERERVNTLASLFVESTGMIVFTRFYQLARPNTQTETVVETSKVHCMWPEGRKEVKYAKQTDEWEACCTSNKRQEKEKESNSHRKHGKSHTHRQKETQTSTNHEKRRNREEEEKNHRIQSNWIDKF